MINNDLDEDKIRSERELGVAHSRTLLYTSIMCFIALGLIWLLV